MCTGDIQGIYYMVYDTWHMIWYGIILYGIGYGIGQFRSRV